MKRCLMVFSAVAIFALAAAAQDVPRMETFLGYTFVRVPSKTDVPSFTANGGSGQFAYNFNTWLGGVADLGAVHNGSINGLPIDHTIANFLFGPRISLRYPRLRPYFQFLFGGVYSTASTAVDVLAAAPPVVAGQPITARVGAQQTAFAMTAGGGLDIKINKYVMFRPIGLDYYMTRLQNLRAQGDNNQNNLRYTAGVNFTFGAR
jgi:opacity protein-like surface antigen